jgi:hypothetical protein
MDKDLILIIELYKTFRTSDTILISAIVALSIADIHRVESNQRQNVQRIRDQIIEAFELGSDLNAIKIIDILRALRRINAKINEFLKY